MTRVYGHHIWISAWVYLAHSAQQQPYYPFVCFLFITDISRRGALDFSYHSGKNFFLFLTISIKILKVNYSIQFFFVYEIDPQFCRETLRSIIAFVLPDCPFPFCQKTKSEINNFLSYRLFLTFNYLLGWGECDTHYGQRTLDEIE